MTGKYITRGSFIHGTSHVPEALFRGERWILMVSTNLEAVEQRMLLPITLARAAVKESWKASLVGNK